MKRGVAFILIVEVLAWGLAGTPVAGGLARAEADRDGESRSPRRAFAIATAALAAASLLAGGALAGVARSRSIEQNGNTASPPLYDAHVQARGVEGASMASAAYALFAVGGTLAVVDLVLWIDLSRRPRAHSAAKLALRVSSP